MIMTSRAATTGTTKFRFDRIMRIVSSALNSGKSREGAIVPATTTTTTKVFFTGRERDREERERHSYRCMYVFMYGIQEERQR